MGCGKTYWGKILAQKMNLPFFDLDKLVEEREEKSIIEIFAEEGEEYFRMLEKDVLHLITESHESFVMACGGGTPCFFNNIEYLKKNGTAVWINCSADCLFERLKKEKSTRPLIRDLSDEELHHFIGKKYSDRKIYYQQANVIINDEEITLEKLVHKIFHN